MPSHPLTEYWYQALAADIGIALQTSDGPRAAQALYRARRDAKDTDLNAIGIVASPSNPNELWLIKRTPDAPQ